MDVFAEDVGRGAAGDDELPGVARHEEVHHLAEGGQQKVDVAVEPSGNAIAGDYMLELEADAYNASDTVEYRVKVTTSSAWGWIGIIIVILVIALLIGVFLTLRRR